MLCGGSEDGVRRRLVPSDSNLLPYDMMGFPDVKARIGFCRVYRYTLIAQRLLAVSSNRRRSFLG